MPPVSVKKDFCCINTNLTSCSDATAAIAIASRRGLGKVRHVEVCQLWLQEKVKNGIVNVVKVGTHENIADALTKYVSRESMIMHLQSTNQSSLTGRHHLVPATEY